MLGLPGGSGNFNASALPGGIGNSMSSGVSGERSVSSPESDSDEVFSVFEEAFGTASGGSLEPLDGLASLSPLLLRAAAKPR